jgi:hypothetical protein
VAILSLKNDLMKVYEPCSVTGHNQLFWSSDLTQRAYDGGIGWEVECSDSGRCPALTLSATSPFSGGLATSELSGIGGPLLGSVPGYRMTLGCLPNSVDVEPICQVGGPEECLPESMDNHWTCQVGDADGAGLTQTLFAAEPGLYVLSWYEKAKGTTPQLQAVVTGANGVPVEMIPETYLPETESFFVNSGWGRASKTFYNGLHQDLHIRFEMVEAPSAEEPTPSVVWAAPQFEYIGPHDSSTEVYPLAFFPTDDDLSSEVSRCEDLDGSTFRSQGNWTYGCEYYCADGFGGTCSQEPNERSLMRCFYETQFSLSLPAIERGELIPSGSLALGNFNYRIDNIAVNLVGSDLRDCSNASHPSSCGSSGFIPYSLQHGPPFRIRNYWGDVYSSPLYIGNIEHAKALADERFLTNPIGTGDQSALAEFTREEFRGRPLEGTYRLRVFDVDGLDWSQLEDVQIALRYRYWTHFGN